MNEVFVCRSCQRVSAWPIRNLGERPNSYCVCGSINWQSLADFIRETNSMGPEPGSGT